MPETGGYRAGQCVAKEWFLGRAPLYTFPCWREQAAALQVAVHELSKALPEEQRPLPLETVEVNDNSSFWLPNSGGTAGSTAAEGACGGRAPGLRAAGRVFALLPPQTLIMPNSTLTLQSLIPQGGFAWRLGYK